MTDAPAPDLPWMFPLMLNVTAVPIMVIGDDRGGRVAMLREYGAHDLHTFAAEPWPTAADFARVRPRLVFITDVEDHKAAAFRALAHDVGAFVHAQDRIPLCDFHLPARIRRGHLQITVSTDGAVAGLSRVLRQHLEDTIFGPEWGARIDELAAARQKWRAEGRSMEETARAVSDFVAARGWLKN